MKLKDIRNEKGERVFPEQKDLEGMVRIHGAGSVDSCIGYGYNQALDEVGSMDQVIDVEKLIDILYKCNGHGGGAEDIAANLSEILRIRSVE